MKLSKTDELLSEVVKKAIDVAEKTGNFVIEQTPLVLQEFYRWHIASDIIGIVICILLFTLSIVIPRIWLDKEKGTYSDCWFFGKYGDSDGWGGGAWFAFAICNVFSIFFLFRCIYDLVFIVIAPKLYLIEYFIK